MAISTRLTQLALLGLSGLAAYSFYTVLIPQGLQDSLNAYAQKHVLPDTSVVVDGLTYTGLEPVDRLLNVLNYFFWPILHDKDYVRKARSQMFIGQFMSAWALVMLESERIGNKGRLVSYIIIWGLWTQAMGYAFAIPTWMALTIGGSYIANPRPATIAVDPRAGRAIPWSVLVGFLIPGILAYLPAPAVWTHRQKMQAMAGWQVFPIWTGLAQFIIKNVFSKENGNSVPHGGSTWRLPQSLKTPYTFILIVAGVIRVGSISRIIYDITYSPFKGATWNVFQQLLFPKLLDPTIRHEVLAAGSATFLEWDETVGQTALVLFATFQCFKVWTPKNESDWGFVFVRLPLTWLFFGSTGVAVALLATRDDFVMRRSVKVRELME